MNPVQEFIFAELDRKLHQAWIDNGWWCPRCDMAAPPLNTNPDTRTTVGQPGWCGMCGLDPLADGPAQPMHPRGITTA